MGNEPEKEWMYIRGSLCCTPETDLRKQLYFNNENNFLKYGSSKKKNLFFIFFRQEIIKIGCS